ncbi:MAG: hypothetical protein OXT74_05770 [Candidatus Poribacteria bacterium]|nr:hypothetical protein [Candidatus Poribacteria bacterium]
MSIFKIVAKARLVAIFRQMEAYLENGDIGAYTNQIDGYDVVRIDYVNFLNCWKRLGARRLLEINMDTVQTTSVNAEPIKM